MKKIKYLGIILWSFLLASPEVWAQAQEAVRLEDPVLRWARGAALAAGVLALILCIAAIFMRRPLNTTGKWLLLVGVVTLPLFVSLSGTGIVLEESKQVAACASCHTMHPFVNDLKNPASQNLAARHYQNRWIPDNQCYSCHTDYHIFGGLRAKVQGVGHLVRYYTGKYELPIRIAAPHRSTICLHCHGPAVKYQKVELHQQLAADLLAHKTSCVECHGPVHPAAAERTQP